LGLRVKEIPKQQQRMSTLAITPFSDVESEDVCEGVVTTKKIRSNAAIIENAR
jgi:hypothetical protein